MKITTHPFEYKDGSMNCIGFIAHDETVVSARPAVLINHAWGGLDDFAKDEAIKMAALGYVGIALDNYGNGEMPATVDEKIAMMTPLKEDRKALQNRLKAGYKAAAALSIVDEAAMAATGFCFGGLCALDMARAGLDLKAVISYHARLNGSGLPAKKIKADILVCHGWDDPLVPAEEVVALSAELGKAGCDWTFMAFGNTKHAFMVPEANDDANGMKYNEDAAQQSWVATQELLNKHFALHGTQTA